jgi:hypothetical protein
VTLDGFIVDIMLVKLTNPSDAPLVTLNFDAQLPAVDEVSNLKNVTYCESNATKFSKLRSFLSGCYCNRPWKHDGGWRNLGGST